MGPVYWKDNTFTIVTTTLSNAVTAEASAFAGILLRAEATPALMTGNWVVILVRGFLAALVVAASPTAGDEVYGTAGDQILNGKVTSGTAPKFPGHDIRALTTSATPDVWVEAEGA